MAGKRKRIVGSGLPDRVRLRRDIVDIPPIGMSCDEGTWMEASIAEHGAFFQGVQTPQGQRGVITWYADNVMIEQELTPELTAWIVEQSLSTPSLMAAALLADAGFASYQDEAEKVDTDVPSLFFVANHWAETAKLYLAEHCPNSRIETLGGHMMFWEYPEQFTRSSRSFSLRRDRDIG